jgi:hypothetical protein
MLIGDVLYQRDTTSSSLLFAGGKLVDLQQNQSYLVNKKSWVGQSHYLEQ